MITNTHKGRICNVQTRGIATSDDAQQYMHWNEVDDKSVPTPWANLQETKEEEEENRLQSCEAA